MRRIQVELERVDDAFHFVARNAAGFEVHIDDATAREDGVAHGVGPMQLLLMGLAGCSGVDVASILRKSRQSIDALRIQVTGLRAENETPSPYLGFHMHFELEGDVDPKRVEHAVRLSVTKYCSAAATLRHAAPVTASYSVNGEHHDTDVRLGPDA
jgi:putative redox protein